MKKDPKNRALEVCLLRMQSGDSLNQVLSAYPRYIATLKPLLMAAQAALNYSNSIQIPDNFQAENRREFIKTAQEIIPQPRRVSSGQLIRWMAIPILLLLIIILALWPLLIRSSTALPGDPLYGLKRLNESIRLALPNRNAEQLWLEISFDQERLLEVNTMIQLGRSGEVEFSGGLAEIDATAWEVGGVQVLILEDTRLVGVINPGFYIRVQGELQPDGSVKAHQIQPVEYLFQGQIQAIDQDNWLVDGVEILLSPQTSILGDPEIRNQVQMSLQLTLEEKLTARLIEIIR